MSTNNSVNLRVTNNSDGFDVAGGTTVRKLTVTGGNITVSGTGTNVFTFPAATDTLVGRASTDTLTNKTINGASNTLTIRLGSDVTGNLATSHLNSGTSASSSTFWRGDGTWATPAGSGTVTATGGSLTANSIVLGAGTTDTKVVAGIVTDGTSVLSLGVGGASVGGINFNNATSGTLTINPPTGALGTHTITLPIATDTLVGKATTDTLTNKTISGGSNTITNVSLATGVTGNLPVTNLNSGTSATSSTFWRGDGTWAVTTGSSPLTTKGDIYTFSTVNARQAVGTDGQVLTADSTQTNGIKWSTVSGTGNMILASAQTNTGAKTFNAGTLLDKGEIVFDVKAYGAAGDGTTNDTAAIQAAVDAAQAAGGGKVWFPAGTYKLVTNPIKMYSGTTPSITAYKNITLAGTGSSFTNGSIIAQSTTGVDVILFQNDGSASATGQTLNDAVEDLALKFSGTATNSGNGIYIKQAQANSFDAQQCRFVNVQVQLCQGSGKYGFNFEGMIVSTVEDCQAQSCANGFFLNGSANAGNFQSISTSVTFINCYSNGSLVNGYVINDATYVSLLGCACDYESNSTGTAYLVQGSSAVSFYGCGCELDGTVTLSNMWKIDADSGSNPSSQVGLYNCFGFFSHSGVDVYVTGGSTNVTVVGFVDNSSVSGATGLKIDAAAQASIIDCNFIGVNGTTATNFNIASTGVLYTPGVVRRNTVASSATPAINIGSTDVFDITAQTANITSMTTNLTGTGSAGQALHISITGTAARTISWGTAFEASTVALPTTTITTNRLDCDFIYNAATSKWRILQSS